MKSVSLIVPVYQAGAFLTPLIRSVQNQDYSDFQLVLSDDGSTDDSMQVMERMAREDSRITVVTGPNCGVSSARNRGLAVAEGKYIGFLDADDLLEPNYLRWCGCWSSTTQIVPAAASPGSMKRRGLWIICPSAIPV